MAGAERQGLTVVQHPLVQDKLSRMRMRRTDMAGFRRLAHELSLLLACEATRDLPLADAPIETPVATATGRFLVGQAPCIVSILRAGNGLLPGMLELMPEAPVGYLGLYREEGTLRPVEYYCKLPPGLAGRAVIVVDPMLATGHTAAAALDRLKQAGADDLRFVCVVAAPEGVKQLREEHPDVPIVTAVLDRELDDNAFIRPGLGDAGDRIFGTRES